MNFVVNGDGVLVKEKVNGEESLVKDEVDGERILVKAASTESEESLMVKTSFNLEILASFIVFHFLL